MKLPNLDISGWSLTLARRLLYSWLRTQVVTAPEAAAIDPARPVCYVIQDRRLSNLLVLMEETRRAGLPPAQRALSVGPLREERAFFCLTRAQPLLASARERYGHSPRLQRLVAALRADARLDVQLVPVTILWGRAPQHQDSVLKALFAEAWRPPSHFRQLVAILLHGRSVLVRIGAPTSLGELAREPMEEPRVLRKVLRLLRVHFRRQREAAIGPDLSHRHTQVEQLLAAPAVRQAIAEEASAKGLAAYLARERARAFALEIASDYSYGVVRAFELVLTWLWTRIYDGLEIYNFDRLAGIAHGQSVVYVPCHRSHIDYLLLSYVVYQRGLSPPHIAAGANLNFPVVGPLLRRGGAFFLRRSFKGEPLYAAVFNEYLHLLVSRGFSIEYFLEGTRSRSGRMLPPRTGILGMTLKSFLRGQERPLVFVPIYIGYEKLIEGKSFLGELAGRPKGGESLWSLLGTVRRLKHEFGKVHVNFGEPLYLADYLDRRHAGWSEDGQQGEAEWLRPVTADLALELIRRIGDSAVVNPINLVSLVLLATPKQAADGETLERMIDHYRELLDQSGHGLMAEGCRASAAEVVAHAVRLGVVERIEHPLGDLLRAPADQAALLAYFRNNVLHLVALPALLACLMARNPRLERRRVEAALVRLHVLLRSELFLRCPALEVPTAISAALSLLVSRGLLRLREEELLAPEPSSREFAELQLLGQTMRPTLERYLLILSLLQQQGSGVLGRKSLEESSHLLAQRLALLYAFNGPEVAEKGVFSQVVANLLGAGLLREDEDGRLWFDERITAPAADAELLLTEEVRQTIRRTAGAGAVQEPVAAGQGIT